MDPEPPPLPGVHIQVEIHEPRCYTTAAILRSELVAGMIGCLPIFVFCMGVIVSFSLSPAIGVAYVIAIVLVCVYYLPRWVNGSAELKEVLRHDEIELREDDMLCQIAFTPPLAGGLRRLLDDADDVGILRLEEDALVFHGDRCRIHWPYKFLTDLETVSGGARVLYLLSRLVLHGPLPEPYRSLSLHERGSRTLPEAWRASDHLRQVLAARMPGAQPGADDPEE